jgi:hypothetical protein
VSAWASTTDHRLLAGLELLGLGLALGALWCLALAFTGSWSEYLPGAVMFALPAGTLLSIAFQWFSGPGER